MRWIYRNLRNARAALRSSSKAIADTAIKTKPFLEIITAFALVYFAWSADTIYRDMTRIQADQKSILDAQNKPSFEGNVTVIDKDIQPDDKQRAAGVPDSTVVPDQSAPQKNGPDTNTVAQPVFSLGFKNQPKEYDIVFRNVGAAISEVHICSADILLFSSERDLLGFVLQPTMALSFEPKVSDVRSIERFDGVNLFREKLTIDYFSVSSAINDNIERFKKKAPAGRDPPFYAWSWEAIHLIRIDYRDRIARLFRKYYSIGEGGVQEYPLSQWTSLLHRIRFSLDPSRPIEAKGENPAPTLHQKDADADLAVLTCGDEERGYGMTF